jgi:hypothetical protein
MNQSKFKPEASFKQGFIANAKEGELSTCRFGGVAWSATGPRPDLGHPALLVTVDFGAPVLNQAVDSKCDFEIPLFSHINLDGIIPLQEYRLNHEAKTATFKPFIANVELLPVKDRLKIPLPESALRLREMRENEISVDEESYWVAIDSFLGGEGAIRLCGVPLYIDYIAPKNDSFRYFASIGYESPDHTGRLLGDEAFFLGEIAHYFFISSDWKTVRVASQAS